MVMLLSVLLLFIYLFYLFNDLSIFETTEQSYGDAVITGQYVNKKSMFITQIVFLL